MFSTILTNVPSRGNKTPVFCDRMGLAVFNRSPGLIDSPFPQLESTCSKSYVSCSLDAVSCSFYLALTVRRLSQIKECKRKTNCKKISAPCFMLTRDCCSSGKIPYKHRFYELFDCLRTTVPTHRPLSDCPFTRPCKKMRQQGKGRGGLCCANSVDNATDFAREKTVPRQLSDENASKQRLFLSSCGSKRGFKDGASACSTCAFSGA